MKIRLWICVFATLFCLPYSGQAVEQSTAELPIYNESQLFDFATYLYQQSEYFRAITEYQRLLYYFPQSQLRPIAEEQIGRAYMAGGEYSQAITHLSSLLEKRAAQGLEEKTVIQLLGLSLLDQDRSLPFRMREPQIEKALKLFGKLDQTDATNQLMVGFSKEWEERPRPDYYSPWIAGISSAILPGAGSFYTKRPVEGSYAFVFTLLFTLASQEGFQSGRRDLGLFFGFFALSFWGGNIYTAVSGAQKSNDQLDSQALEAYRSRYGLWFFPAKKEKPGRF